MHLSNTLSMSTHKKDSNGKETTLIIWLEKIKKMLHFPLIINDTEADVFKL